MTIDELNELLKIKSETETIEFKEAKNQISITGGISKEKKCVYGYAVALGNEGGGKLLLGVADKINKKTHKRNVVGTHSIENVAEVKAQIYKLLRAKIEIDEIQHPDGRVVVITVPSRSIGQYFKFYGLALMRVNDELIEMDDLSLHDILNEGTPDFTAEICEGLQMKDLDTSAILVLKNKWADKSGNINFKLLSDKDVLKKLLLLRDKKLTYGALLLAGKEEALGLHLPNAEYILEWRAEKSKLAYDFRKNWRKAFLLIYDDIWSNINARNTRVPIQKGFIERDIWSYNEQTFREALLNAFGHREYRNRVEPVFIKLSPDQLMIKSPGGFVPGVNGKTALHAEGKWRNRLLMEVLEKVGLVERAGVGLDRIYTETISSGKGMPIFDESDISTVILNIPTAVKDIRFVHYLQQVILHRKIPLSENEVDDIVFLENIRINGKSIDENRKDKFLELGIIEKYGRGPGLKYVLSKDFYEFIRNKGEYTRKKWLSKEEQKTLVIKYLEDHNKVKLGDFLHPTGLFEGKLTKDQIKRLFFELRLEKKIYFDGLRRSSKGFWRLMK